MLVTACAQTKLSSLFQIPLLTTLLPPTLPLSHWLLSYDLATRTIRLHEVIRRYLYPKAQPRLTSLHGQFLDSYHLPRWANLPPTELYLWEHLATHLLAAELLAAFRSLRRHSRSGA